MRKWKPTQKSVKKAFLVAGFGAIMAVSGVIAFLMFKSLWGILLFVAGASIVVWVEQW
jgi:hypothetical protein